MNTNEAAAYLSASRRTLRTWTEQGRLTPRLLPDGRKLYAKDDLDRFNAERSLQSRATSAGMRSYWEAKKYESR